MQPDEIDLLPLWWRWELIVDSLTRVSGNTSSKKAFELVKTWLSNCLDNHERCQRKGDANKKAMPTRLLDVSSTRGGVRLVETREMTGPVPYICLSHCWGDASKQFTTTRRTLEKRKRGIFLNVLPRLFKDVIKYVRRLGITHLWIDSLCIVQDDAEDWKQESTRMCMVYQNALLTIAATKCADSSESLFSKSSARAARIEWIFRKSAMLRRNGQFTAEFGHFYWPYPLLSRAWVYQERLLSKRVLHFARGEIYWECMESAECECGLVMDSAMGLLNYESEFPYKNVHDRMPKRTSSHPEKSNVILWQWHDIVTEYTSLSMTLVSDKLPAILGLAQEIQSRRGGRFIAGLWEDTLISDLAWVVNNECKGFKPRPSKSVTHAPSWSWASLDTTQCWYFGTISDKGGLDRSLQLLSIQYPKPSDFPTDPKALGCIILRGILAPVTVSGYWKSHRSREVISAMGKSEWRGEYDCDYDHFLPKNGEYYVPPNEIVYFLYLGSYSTTVDEPPKRCCDLVLRCIDPSNQVYERIGSRYRRFDSKSDLERALEIYKDCPEVVINLV
jgi:hypothetical protein